MRSSGDRPKIGAAKDYHNVDLIEGSGGKSKFANSLMRLPWSCSKFVIVSSPLTISHRPDSFMLFPLYQNVMREVERRKNKNAKSSAKDGDSDGNNEGSGDDTNGRWG